MVLVLVVKWLSPAYTAATMWVAAVIVLVMYLACPLTRATGAPAFCPSMRN